ncbi:DUF1036 domain-containing protein [Anabaena sp. FACHB-1237]|uniref:DUF1036 domain-containing protein n=1 Tax=Anabaena sp. FACHB-1237 TaxID=2692769 RepID=UPI0016819A27|nr:DUF1036 domain-containing protein [Anabaena sp. FACHB-1237]MBD2136516.1 DUF1036 domain-containing protein [Anabaena sp. FACHB-1237]
MRKLLSAFSIPLLAVGFLLAKPQEAKAWFRVCNDTGQDAHVAFGYPEGGKWYSQGWYVVSAETCQEVYPHELRNRTYYVHAQDYDGNTWGDDINFCNYWVQFRRRFKREQTDKTRNNCFPPNQGLMGFVEVNTGGARNFTFRLTD